MTHLDKLYIDFFNMHDHKQEVIQHPVTLPMILSIDRQIVRITQEIKMFRQYGEFIEELSKINLQYDACLLEGMDLDIIQTWYSIHLKALKLRYKFI